MLDLAGDAREQTDTRIMDALQMPRLKRQKPLQIKALSVSFFILVLSIATEWERREGRRYVSCSKPPASLSQRDRRPRIKFRSSGQGGGGDIFVPWISSG